MRLTASTGTKNWPRKSGQEGLILRQQGGVVKVDDKWQVNPNAENLANLSPGYYERGMQGKKEDWIKVNLGNQYGFVVDGGPIHPDNQDSMHCRNFELDPRLPLMIDMDFGLTPAVVFAQRRAMGGWRIRSELVATNMGAEKFAHEIHLHLAHMYQGFHICGFWGYPSGDNRAQSDETTPFQILKAANLPAMPAPTNAPLLRRGAVDGALTRIIDGEPGLLVHSDCKTLRKALAGGYCYRRLAVSGERFADAPVKNSFS